MLHLADILFTILHIVIIVFNLFGWIFPSMRKAHFAVVLVTLFCWFVLGFWFGWGYCPLTDWQWQVKEKLGATNLPPSFISWLAEKVTGIRYSDSLVNTVTLVLFLIAIAASVYVNFFRRNKME